MKTAPDPADPSPAPTVQTSLGLLEPWEAGLVLNIPLEMAERKLRLWRSRGEGPRYVLFGGLVRYRREDLSRWVEERTIDPATRREPKTAPKRKTAPRRRAAGGAK